MGVSATVHVFVIIENRFIGLGFLQKKKIPFSFVSSWRKTSSSRSSIIIYSYKIVDYFDEITILILTRAIAWYIRVRVFFARGQTSLEREYAYRDNNDTIINVMFFLYNHTNFMKKKNYLHTFVKKKKKTHIC